MHLDIVRSEYAQVSVVCTLGSRKMLLFGSAFAAAGKSIPFPTGNVSAVTRVRSSSRKSGTTFSRACLSNINIKYRPLAVMAGRRGRGRKGGARRTR